MKADKEFKYKVEIRFSLKGSEPTPLFGTAGAFFSALDAVDSLLENLLGFRGASRHDLLGMEAGVLSFECHHSLYPQKQCLLGGDLPDGALSLYACAFRQSILSFLQAHRRVDELQQLEELARGLNRLVPPQELSLHLAGARVSPEQILDLLAFFHQAAREMRREDGISLNLAEHDYPFSAEFTLDAESLRRRLSEEGRMVFRRRGVLEAEHIPRQDTNGRYRGRFFFRRGRHCLSVLPSQMPPLPQGACGDLLDAQWEEIISPRGAGSHYRLISLQKRQASALSRQGSLFPDQEPA